MRLLAKHNMAPPGRDETVFRVALRGPLLAWLLFSAGGAGGAVFFVAAYRASSLWAMLATGLYTLLMTWLCQILWHTVGAVRSPANWLARIGPSGIILKYRSYLHDDSPAEDPIALQLAWPEMAEAQMQREIHTSSDSDGKSEIRRWFLVIRLDPRYLEIETIKTALAFENQRKPAHFKVDALQHDLFIARKSGAAKEEITRLKQEIVVEKKRHPGARRKTQFHDRPIVFIAPDQLKMEWTHITPGRKRLMPLLAHYTRIVAGHEQRFDTTLTAAEPDFQAQLTALLGRNEKIEAIKLVRRQLGLGLAEAKAYVEKIQA